MNKLIIILLTLLPFLCEAQTRKTLFCARGYTIMEYSDCGATFIQVFKPDENRSVQFSEYPVLHKHRNDSVLYYNFGKMKFFYLKKSLALLCEYGEDRTCVNFYNDEMKLNILR